MLRLKHVEIYTDGACSGNPGPGGWGAVLFYGDTKKELSGGARHTTNQRMEMKAVIEGLKALKEPCRVTIYSDSAYVINAFKQNWLDNWERNGWLNSKKEPVKNQELWQELQSLSQMHDVHWVKVKGHSDNRWNNRADELAVAAIAQ